MAWGAWGAPLIKRPTLDFGLGHDLMVRRLKSYVGLRADSVEPAWDSLSPSLLVPLPPPLHSLSLKINKQT